jgi:hypothetical protein
MERAVQCGKEAPDNVSDRRCASSASGEAKPACEGGWARSGRGGSPSFGEVQLHPFPLNAASAGLLQARSCGCCCCPGPDNGCWWHQYTALAAALLRWPKQRWKEAPLPGNGEQGPGSWCCCHGLGCPGCLTAVLTNHCMPPAPCLRAPCPSPPVRPLLTAGLQSA